MRIKFIILAVVFGAGLLSCSKTVEDVIEENLKARGGKDVAVINTISYEGTAKSPGIEIPYKLYIEFPDKLRYELVAFGNMNLTIMNGKEAWIIDSIAKPVPEYQMSSFSETINHQKRLFDTDLVNYKKKGYSPVLLDDDTLNGKDVYRIELTRDDSSVVIYFVDKDSYLELKTVSTSVLAGRKLEQTIYYSDFKNIKGYIIPCKWTYKIKDENNNEQITQELIYENIRINDKLNDSLFTLPSKTNLSSPDFQSQILDTNYRYSK